MRPRAPAGLHAALAMATIPPHGQGGRASGPPCLSTGESVESPEAARGSAAGVEPESDARPEAHAPPPGLPERGGAGVGRAVLELRPDPRAAFRFYLLLAVASTFGVAACVILFAGATAGSLTLLVIQVGMMEFAFHFGLAGVFYDFYRGERGRAWRLTPDGVTIAGGGRDRGATGRADESEAERFIPWSDVKRAYPRSSSVCLETGRDAEPHKLHFVSSADRDRFYRFYLAETMFPFEHPAESPDEDLDE